MQICSKRQVSKATKARSGNQKHYVRCKPAYLCVHEKVLPPHLHPLFSIDYFYGAFSTAIVPKEKKKTHVNEFFVATALPLIKHGFQPHWGLIASWASPQDLGLMAECEKPLSCMIIWRMSSPHCGTIPEWLLCHTGPQLAILCHSCPCWPSGHPDQPSRTICLSCEKGDSI